MAFEKMDDIEILNKLETLKDNHLTNFRYMFSEEKGILTCMG